MRPEYRFKFDPDVALEEVEGTLRLSVLACQALHGESQVVLDARHDFDPRKRICTIASGTPAGRDLARLFETFVRREFGPSAFRVERTEEPMARSA